MAAGREGPLLNTRSPWPRTCAGLGLALLLGLAGGGAVAAEESAVSEYRLKVAFLFRFTQFIEWPAAAWARPDDAFVLCILGPDPFGEALQELGSRRHGNRPLRLQYLATAREARGCQLVYVDKPSPRELGELLAAVRDAPVLTVSSAPDFADAGGGLGFVQAQGRLRFEVNLDGLRQSSLRPSAKLLEVAARLVGPVKGRPE